MSAVEIGDDDAPYTPEDIRAAVDGARRAQAAVDGLTGRARRSPAAAADWVDEDEETEAEDPDPVDPLRNFAVHLQARMRLLNWTQQDLQDRAAIKTPQIAARAINGTGVDLGLAGRIADLIGLDLGYMIRPYECGTCNGEPPTGYQCLECGTEGERQ